MSKRLDEIEARVEAATPRPWVPHCDHEDTLRWLCNDKDVALVLGGPDRVVVAEFEVGRYDEERKSMDPEPREKAAVVANIDLIANAPADLRHLLAIARAAERHVRAFEGDNGDLVAALYSLRAALESKEDVR